MSFMYRRDIVFYCVIYLRPHVLLHWLSFPINHKQKQNKNHRYTSDCNIW